MSPCESGELQKGYGRRREMAGGEKWWEKRNGKKGGKIEDMWGIPQISRSQFPKSPNLSLVASMAPKFRVQAQAHGSHMPKLMPRP